MTCEHHRSVPTSRGGAEEPLWLGRLMRRAAALAISSVFWLAVRSSAKHLM